MLYTRLYAYYIYLLQFILISKYSSKILIKKTNIEKIVLSITLKQVDKMALYYANLIILFLTGAKGYFFSLKSVKSMNSKSFKINGFKVNLRKSAIFLFIDNFINLSLSNMYEFEGFYDKVGNFKVIELYLKDFLKNNYYLNQFPIDDSYIMIDLQQMSYMKIRYEMQHTNIGYNKSLLRFLKIPIF